MKKEDCFCETILFFSYELSVMSFYILFPYFTSGSCNIVGVGSSVQ